MEAGFHFVEESIMKELYAKIKNHLNHVVFEDIWPGFSMYDFALYDEDNEFEGRFIAIWKVYKPTDEIPEILAANLVHEMFHAFQKQEKDNRYPNDLIMLDYPENLENYICKYSENLLLVEAFVAADIHDKKA